MENINLNVTLPTFSTVDFHECFKVKETKLHDILELLKEMNKRKMDMPILSIFEISITFFKNVAILI